MASVSCIYVFELIVLHNCGSRAGRVSNNKMEGIGTVVNISNPESDWAPEPC